MRQTCSLGFAASAVRDHFRFLTHRSSLLCCVIAAQKKDSGSLDGLPESFSIRFQLFRCSAGLLTFGSSQALRPSRSDTPAFTNA